MCYHNDSISLCPRLSTLDCAYIHFRSNREPAHAKAATKVPHFLVESELSLRRAAVKWSNGTPQNPPWTHTNPR
jgi:hypothetical protein